METFAASALVFQIWKRWNYQEDECEPASRPTQIRAAVGGLAVALCRQWTAKQSSSTSVSVLALI
jgi:hypothetical protein